MAEINAMIFYTYLHVRPDGTPFYVGKGHGKRSHSFEYRNRHHSNVIAKYGKENITVKILKRNLTEEEAFSNERDAIACLREFGHQLCNKTDGGEGTSGLKWTEVKTIQMRSIMAGNKFGTGNTNRRGKRHSEESKKKMSQSKIGVTAWNKGKPHSDEMKIKLSQAKMGAVLSDQHKNNIRQALIGIKRKPPNPFSESHRKNLSNASKRGWEKRRMG